MLQKLVFHKKLWRKNLKAEIWSDKHHLQDFLYSSKAFETDLQPVAKSQGFLWIFIHRHFQLKEWQGHTFSNARDLCIFGRPVVISNLKKTAKLQ